MARPVPYPLLARLLLELKLLQRLRAARLELLLLEGGPLVGDPRVLLDILPLARLALLLGLLLAFLHHLAAAAGRRCFVRGRKGRD